MYISVCKRKKSFLNCDRLIIKKMDACLTGMHWVISVLTGDFPRHALSLFLSATSMIVNVNSK